MIVENVGAVDVLGDDRRNHLCLARLLLGGDYKANVL